MNSGRTLARKLTILNELGLYARPSALVVKTLAAYLPDTKVTISSEERSVEGHSIMGLLTLEGYQGRVLTVEARGPAAEEVLDALTDLVNAGFQSGEKLLPIPPSHTEWIDLSAGPEEAEDGDEELTNGA